MCAQKQRIAILGGGPSALFAYKRLLETGCSKIEIHIHESQQLLGAGMPYSFEGANGEHVTNVSGNEVPEIVSSIADWIQTVPQGLLEGFGLQKERFSEYRVLPRLLFGQYLSEQFNLLLQKAERQGVQTIVHLASKVIDIVDQPENDKVQVQIQGGDLHAYERIIICTGHNWSAKHEGLVKGYFDSPYPPAKLKLSLNHPVAIRGSSLTAIDAVRTLARSHGHFEKRQDGLVSYIPDASSEHFKMVLHSKNGLLPAIRFHLDEPLLLQESLLTKQQLSEHMINNDGFVSLDYIFDKGFKDLLKEKDPGLYGLIKDMQMEAFIGRMMERREQEEPFELFEAEYRQAAMSIKNQESIHWKEMLAVLSFVMNYPAKYLSAEDTLRMQKVLLPLISIVIAFTPQESAQELIALHQAGKLEITAVGEDSRVTPQDEGGITYEYTNEHGVTCHDYYETFVDSIGQPHLDMEDLPFKSLVERKTVSPAMIKFRSKEQGKSMLKKEPERVKVDQHGNYYLSVSGIAINDYFQVVDAKGIANERIYMMAVPYMGGYNPDYSGLDFCEQASHSIVKNMMRDRPAVVV